MTGRRTTTNKLQRYFGILLVLAFAISSLMQSVYVPKLRTDPFVQDGMSTLSTHAQQNTTKRTTLTNTNATFSPRNTPIPVDSNYNSTTISNAATISKLATLTNQPFRASTTLLLQENDGAIEFPITRFTPHVERLVSLVNSTAMKECRVLFHIHVPEPYSAPSSIECPNQRGISNWWCTVLKGIFLSKSPYPTHLTQGYSRSNDSIQYQRILPGNVSIAFAASDFVEPRKYGYKCIGSSGPKGKNSFSMTNFQDIQRLANAHNAQFGLQHVVETFLPRPWENRSTIPVWRGTPRTQKGRWNASNPDVLREALSREPPKRRLKAVLWSKYHPSLLNARISVGKVGFLKHKAIWERNATNQLHQLLPLHSIPPTEYYTQYQVALVLGGIGAAFRTSTHLSTSTAIVLQDYLYEEWFIPYMTPYQHYIPLAFDLSNLSDTMQWVQDNPTKVRQIAEQGHQFYKDYLSFEGIREHAYELLFRLSLKALETKS